MKTYLLLFLSITLFSCKKDKQELITYEVVSNCDKIYITYEENGAVVDSVIDPYSKGGAWVHKFMRKEGTDIAFTYSCVGDLRKEGAIVKGYINGSWQYLASDVDHFDNSSGSFRAKAKDLDKLYN